MNIKFLSDNTIRLDKYISQNTNFSRNQIQKLINNNLVLVNNKPVLGKYILKKNDIVKILENKLSSKANIKNNSIFKKIRIIFQNDDFLVIYKPAGLAVHKTHNPNEITLVDFLLKKFPQIKGVGEEVNRPGIVHRIDKNVSGLLVIALHNKQYEYFKNLFITQKIKKSYLALVYDNIINDSGKINFRIQRSKQNKTIMAALPEKTPLGKEASTKYKVLKRYPKYTLLKLKLITGRTHQIRVHLKAFGHSIVNDHKYSTKRQVITENLDQIFLHAYKIKFIDINGKKENFMPHYRQI